MEGLSQYQGQLIFVLEPGEKASSDEEAERMYLRPNFSFDPKNDPLLPCHDAGVEFTPGVVLEVGIFSKINKDHQNLRCYKRKMNGGGKRKSSVIQLTKHLQAREKSTLVSYLLKL